jgi:hypothetical protein
LRAAAGASWDEAVLYARTAAGFARHPRRFLEEWKQGVRRAQNPLGFMATTLAVTAALQLARQSLPGATDEAHTGSPLWNGLLESAGPYAHYLVLGVVSHAVLRLARARGRLLGSVAATLYPAGIALLVIGVLFFLGALVLPTFRRSGAVSHSDVRALTTAIVVFGVSYAAFVVLLVAALGRLHRAPWRVAMAIFAAIVASALFFGMVHPPGSYGLHPSLRVQRDDRGRITAGLDLTLH